MIDEKIKEYVLHYEIIKLFRAKFIDNNKSSFFYFQNIINISKLSN